MCRSVLTHSLFLQPHPLHLVQLSSYGGQKYLIDASEKISQTHNKLLRIVSFALELLHECLELAKARNEWFMCQVLYVFHMIVRF